MDIFDQGIIEFWKALAQYSVRYITVGGFATNLHGYQRYTGDMDIWIEDTLVNRRNLRLAFAALGMGDYPMLETMQIIPGWTEFYLPNGLRLDLLISMIGLEQYSFDECLKVATKAEIEDVTIYFLHINQLIANKKSVNRPKDQSDVVQLEKIKALRDEQMKQ